MRQLHPRLGGREDTNARGMVRLALSRVTTIWLASLCALATCVPALPLLESGDASGFITFDALRGEPYNVTYDERRAPAGNTGET